jgi:hypothetical protein
MKYWAWCWGCLRVRYFLLDSRGVGLLLSSDFRMLWQVRNFVNVFFLCIYKDVYISVATSGKFSACRREVVGTPASYSGPYFSPNSGYPDIFLWCYSVPPVNWWCVVPLKYTYTVSFNCLSDWTYRTCAFQWDTYEPLVECVRMVCTCLWQLATVRLVFAMRRLVRSCESKMLCCCIFLLSLN